MPDNPAKYRTLTPTGRCCSKDWGVADSVEFGSSVGTPDDFIPFEIWTTTPMKTMHMSTAKKNVSSLDTLSWKSCDVKRQIKVYTTTTRLIKTRVVISLNPRFKNINPPTIAKITVDGLKGRKRSWLNTVN